MSLSGIQTIRGEKTPPITPLEKHKDKSKKYKKQKLLRKKEPSSVGQAPS